MTALAACGESGGTTATDDPSTGATGGSSQSTETFKIGVFGPSRSRRARTSATERCWPADELNAKGEGPKVEIVFCDSEAKPDKAIACITKFAQQDKVQAISGGFSSAETLAILDTVKRAKIPYVSAGAAAPDVVKGVDSTGPASTSSASARSTRPTSPSDMCLTVTTKLTKLGFSKFAILHEDAAFAIPLVEVPRGLPRQTRSRDQGQDPDREGRDLVGTEKFTPSATKFEAPVQELHRQGRNFVIEISSTQVGIQLGKAWATLQPNFADGRHQRGRPVVGVLRRHQGRRRAQRPRRRRARSGLGEDDPVLRRLPGQVQARPALQRRRDLRRHLHAARGGGARREPDADDLVTELEKTDRIGASGVEKFNEQHDVVYSPSDPKEGLSLLYFQYQADGSKKIVYPETLAEGNTYQMPPGVAK
jgi:hypothetical protein